jgi:hypothetical protein
MRFFFLALWAGALSTQAATLDLAPGSYSVASQIVMPHLDAMRREVETSRRCLSGATPRELFSVFDQPALRGCDFAYPRATAQGVEYVLRCQSALVATGTLSLQRAGPDTVGLAAIKMGGKNMTFTQRVVARRLGACDER